MKKISKIFKRKNIGSMGIGAMIIFIAMVLVAGIAASVLVQVANTLQMQALYTGHETIEEVATGVAVLDVEGHVTGSVIDKLVIGVRGRAGSGDIDLSQLVIEIADTQNKMVLIYNESQHQTSPSNSGVFNTSVFNLSGINFGILVLEDADGSCGTAATPIINKGDYVMLTINTTATFGGLQARMDIWGNVIPEIGSWGIISFRTPPTFTDEVYDLQ